MVVGIFGLGAVLVSSGAITNIFAPRTASTDVVDDPTGLIGVNQSVTGTGDTSRLTNLTNNLNQTVDLVIELTGTSPEWGSLFVNGVDYGNSAHFDGVPPGGTRGVDIAVICSDAIVGNSITYRVTSSDAGITGTLDTRRATIEKRCLTWYTAQDWDNATSEHGVVHEDFGDRAAEDVELGYNTSEPGLVSYWHFDEDSGSTANDAAGSNDGSSTGAATGHTGVLNTTAYRFDGNGDNVSVPDDSTLDITGDLTASTWVDPDSTPTVRDVNDSGYVSHQFIGMKWDGGAADCTSNATFDPTIINPYNAATYGDGNWHAGSSWGVYNTTDQSVYGSYSPRIVDFDSVWGTNASNSEAYAGAYIYSPNSRNVQIQIGSDDTRKLWVNGVLEHQDCNDQTLAVDDSRVNGVRLHEGWNTIVVMVNENSGNWGVQWRISNRAGGLRYVADPMVLVDKLGYQLALKGTNVTATYGGTTADTDISTGSYSHVAMRADTGASTIDVFVNGTQRESVSLSSSPSANDQNFIMGENLDGRLDEVRLYDTPLSNDRIGALANGSHPHNATAAWNGTHVTAWESADSTLDVTTLELSDVVADTTGGTVTVYIESDTNGDGTVDETSSAITLNGSGGPYDVSGLTTDTDRFRLRVEMSTPTITDAPCFSGATVSTVGGLGNDSRHGCGITNTGNSPPTASFTYTDTRNNWYNNSWENRKKLTLDHTQVASDVEDFPVLVTFTSSDLAAGAQADGDDILFTTANGSVQLDHEIESYNNSTGHLVAWVKVPQVNATSPDTEIYLYYNNSGTANQENPPGVWSNEYVLVQHLNESSGSVIDSSGFSNDGTNNGATQGTSGKIGTAYDFETDNDEYVEIPTDSSLNVSYVHYSAWVRAESSVDNMGIMAKGGDSTRQYWVWHFNDTIHYEVDENEYTTDYPNLTTDTWHKIDIVYNGSTTRAYLNGSLQAANSQSTGTVLTDDGSLYIGQLPGLEQWDGILDEVRVRDGSADDVATAGWIATSYNNTNDPSRFHSVGTEETNGTISFDATNSSDADGTVETYKWDYDDDGVYEETTTSPTTTRDLSPGEHEVTLQVIDDDSATGSVSKTVTAVTEPPTARFSYTDTWSNRKTITIDHTKVATDLTDYPVLINLSDSDLATGAQPDGDDILFTDTSGAQLDHEIEKFNSSTGRLIAWVNTPSVSASSATQLYMYYNNSEAANQENASGVWSNGYVLVHHFDESSGDAVDSTTYGNNGTVNGATPGARGKVDGAYDFETDNSEYVEVSTAPSLNTSYVHYSAWVKAESLVDNMGIIAKGDNTTRQYWAWHYNGTIHYEVNETAYKEDYPALSTDTWYKLDIVYNGTTTRSYLNGSLQASHSQSGGPIVTDDGNLYIGQLPGYEQWDGVIDEVRVRDGAAGNVSSEGWIGTAYNNTANPSSFYSVGSETSTVAARVNAANSTDPDGAISTYKWDWDNDGSYETTSSTPLVVHDFGAAGSYTVTLRVTDNEGATNSTVNSVTVGGG